MVCCAENRSLSAVEPPFGVNCSDGTNWYSYVENNPINLIDPTGLQSVMPSFKDFVSFYASNVKDSFSVLVGAASGDENSQRVLSDASKEAGKNLAISSLRGTADIADTVADGANVTMVGSLATGNLPAAGTAGTVAIASDAASFVLNGSADMIEGELSSETTTSLGSLVVDLVAFKLAPKINTGSMRFHSQLNGTKGQFVKTTTGSATSTAASIFSKVAGFVGGLFGGSQEETSGEETCND